MEWHINDFLLEKWGMWGILICIYPELAKSRGAPLPSLTHKTDVMRTENEIYS